MLNCNTFLQCIFYRTKFYYFLTVVLAHFHKGKSIEESYKIQKGLLCPPVILALNLVLPSQESPQSGWEIIFLLWVCPDGQPQSKIALPCALPHNPQEGGANPLCRNFCNSCIGAVH